MNIFIYGNASFRSDIHKVFEHSNIKFRLNNSDSIQEIDTLIELRTAIENHPKEIFLIDDAKIFRKNALNQKIKFLKPNDAIEEEFIKQHGVDDISINSLAELPKYVIKKLEESHSDNLDDDYHSSNDNLDIQESIINIVDEAYSEEDKTNVKDVSNIDEDNDKIQLDDELSSLLVFEDPIIEDDEDEDEKNAIIDSLEKENSENEVEDETFTEDVVSEITELEGENMSDEFSELDSLNESDILEALDGLDDVNINSIMTTETKNVNHNNSTQSPNNLGLEMNSGNVNDIAALISNLLNNKPWK